MGMKKHRRRQYRTAAFAAILLSLVFLQLACGPSGKSESRIKPVREMKAAAENSTDSDGAGEKELALGPFRIGEDYNREEAVKYWGVRTNPGDTEEKGETVRIHHIMGSFTVNGEGKIESLLLTDEILESLNSKIKNDDRYREKINKLATPAGLKLEDDMEKATALYGKPDSENIHTSENGEVYTTAHFRARSNRETSLYIRAKKADGKISLILIGNLDELK